MKSLMILAALTMSTAAMAQDGPDSANPPPFCSKSVTDNCMQRSEAPHAMRHHMMKKKHHVTKKRMHHKAKPMMKKPMKAPAAPHKS